MEHRFKWSDYGYVQVLGTVFSLSNQQVTRLGYKQEGCVFGVKEMRVNLLEDLAKIIGWL